MQDSWIGLTEPERKIVLKALRSLQGKELGAIEPIINKLNKRGQYPLITVGVHGGQVQWTLGNPFPVRICDYDGEGKDDLPDVDERGQDCRMWLEPADPSGLA